MAREERKRDSFPLELTKEVIVAPKGRTVAEAPEAVCLIRIGSLDMVGLFVVLNGKQQRLISFTGESIQVQVEAEEN